MPPTSKARRLEGDTPVLLLMGTIAIVLVMVSRAEARRNLARRLVRISLGHLLFVAGVGALGLLLFWLFEAEGLRLFGFMLPELTVWFGLFDAALLIDASLAAAAMLAMARFRPLREHALQVLRSVWRAVSARRAGRSRSARARVRRPAEPGRDDPDPAWFSRAFASQAPLQTRPAAAAWASAG